LHVAGGENLTSVRQVSWRGWKINTGNVSY
jgi:hypothetical protein